MAHSPASQTVRPRNALVFHAGALGDFVLTWPVLLGIARVLAQHRVIAVCGGDKGRLASRVLGIECRDAESGWPALFGEGDLPEKPGKLLAGASHVLSYVADRGSIWEQNVRRLAPGATVFCLPARPEIGAYHVAHSPPDGADASPPATSVAACHVAHLSADPVLHAAASGMLSAVKKNGLLPRVVDPAGPLVVHPGSGSGRKNLPPRVWLPWIGRQAGWCRVILGEAELERLAPSEVDGFAAAAEVVRLKDLNALLDALIGARGFAGHDSGPTHLAAMLGLPTLAVFGPASDATAWSPVGPRVRVVHPDGWPDVDPGSLPDVIGIT